MTGRPAQAPALFGASSRACFEQVLALLETGESATPSHAELEEHLQSRGRELLRRLLQDHLSLRATTQARLVLVVADGKGIVMRPDALRPATARAAAAATTKWPRVCPRARDASGNGWPRLAPSMT